MWLTLEVIVYYDFGPLVRFVRKLFVGHFSFLIIDDPSVLRFSEFYLEIRMNLVLV